MSQDLVAVTCHERRLEDYNFMKFMWIVKMSLSIFYHFFKFFMISLSLSLYIQYFTVCICLLGIFCHECAQDVISSLGYILCISVVIFRVICVQMTRSSLDDRKDIFANHIIIIVKLEEWTFAIILILCVVVSLKWFYHHILSVALCRSQESWGFFFQYYGAVCNGGK